MTTMKAWRYSSTNGGLEKNLELTDIPKFDAQELPNDYVLVEVIYASLNPADYKVPEMPVVGKMFVGSPATPAMDFSGKIAAVHPSVTERTVGQLVFGRIEFRSQASAFRCGSLAEYLVLPATTGCVPVPEGVDMDQAAGAPTVGLTACQAILPHLKPDGHIVVHGSSGGVGTFCIQVAKAIGAKVTAVCSTTKVQLCKELGADEVIDYKTTNVVETLKSKGQVYDLVVDTVGSGLELYKASNTYLKLGGRFAQIGGSNKKLFDAATYQLLPSFLGGVSRPFTLVLMNQNIEDLKKIAGWMAEGKIHTVIDSTFPFEEAQKAFEHLKKGHATGKVIVKIKNLDSEASIYSNSLHK